MRDNHIIRLKAHVSLLSMASVYYSVIIYLVVLSRLSEEELAARADNHLNFEIEPQFPDLQALLTMISATGNMIKSTIKINDFYIMYYRSDFVI